MTPLQVDSSGLPGGWADVTAGDAVVAFGRRAIYKARKVLIRRSGCNLCLGMLSPQIRGACAIFQGAIILGLGCMRFWYFAVDCFHALLVLCC
jgi:hypothetical protein